MPEEGRFVRKWAGRSKENPPRWWFSWGFGEIRVYRWGFELFLGPSQRFFVVEFGNDGVGHSHFYWVTS